MARYKKRSDGLYQKQITITVKGKKKQKAFYAKTIPELERKVREYRQEEESNNLTFQAVADEWWEEHEPTIAHSSKSNYSCSYREAKEYFFDVLINNIKASDVNKYLINLANKKYSQKTVSMRLQVVRQIMNHAVLSDIIPYNVALSVSIPNGLAHNKREPASKEDIEKIKKSDCLMAKLALYTGCRRGELLALQYEDIDWENKTINISKSVYHVGNSPHIKSPKTKAGIRKIPLLPELEKILSKNKNGYILNYDGKLLANQKAWTMWDNICKELKISCTLHQLRHAYATRLYEIGIDVKSAQYIMGHADISTTQNIYTHITDKKMKDNFEKLKNF